jgi:hypothetical protein
VWKSLAWAGPAGEHAYNLNGDPVARVPYNIIGIMHHANYALYYAKYARGVFSMDKMHNVHNVVMSSKPGKIGLQAPILVPLALESLCRPLRRALRPEDLRLYGAGV